jgi:cell wall-associated NlpC family hydrolase
MKKRLVLVALPALLSVSLAAPTYAMGDDGEEVQGVEQTYGTSAIQTVMDYVHAQLGKRYVFGAKGPDAFDCSGLVLAAYAQIGIKLPHGSVWQSHMGWAVSSDDIQPGDLLFFYGGQAPARSRGHVGIAVSATEMISAPRPGVPVHKVRIPRNVEAIRRYVG